MAAGSGSGAGNATTNRDSTTLETLANELEHHRERIIGVYSKLDRAADAIFGQVPESAGDSATKPPQRPGQLGVVLDTSDRVGEAVTMLERIAARFQEYDRGIR